MQALFDLCNEPSWRKPPKKNGDYAPFVSGQGDHVLGIVSAGSGPWRFLRSVTTIARAIGVRARCGIMAARRQPSSRPIHTLIQPASCWFSLEAGGILQGLGPQKGRLREHEQRDQFG
jgi:hypothetical protein